MSTFYPAQLRSANLTPGAQHPRLFKEITLHAMLTGEPLRIQLENVQVFAERLGISTKTLTFLLGLRIDGHGNFRCADESKPVRINPKTLMARIRTQFNSDASWVSEKLSGMKVRGTALTPETVFKAIVGRVAQPQDTLLRFDPNTLWSQARMTEEQKLVYVRAYLREFRSGSQMKQLLEVARQRYPEARRSQALMLQSIYRQTVDHVGAGNLFQLGLDQFAEVLHWVFLVQPGANMVSQYQPYLDDLGLREAEITGVLFKWTRMEFGADQPYLFGYNLGQIMNLPKTPSPQTNATLAVCGVREVAGNTAFFNHSGAQVLNGLAEWFHPGQTET